MKTNNLLTILAIFALGAFANFTAPCCYADSDDDPVTIFIGEPGIGDTPIIRGPDQIPISASYYSSLSTILVNCRYDLGSMNVEIENLTTGTYTQASINATQGVHPFLISGEAGVYEISFTLSDGHLYLGSFEIE